MNTRYGNKIAMDTFKNEGYEPWRYAESLVDAWIAEGYPRAYAKTHLTAELRDRSRATRGIYVGPTSPIRCCFG